MSTRNSLIKSQKIDARVVQAVRSLRQSSIIKKPSTSLLQSKPGIKKEIKHPGTANTKIYIDVHDINNEDNSTLHNKKTRPNTDKEYNVIKEGISELLVNQSIKYCENLMKKDIELYTLWKNISNNYNNINDFLDKEIFGLKRFVYKLEQLLGGNDICGNGNKDDFFKKEITRVIKNISLDIQFNNKYKDIYEDINNYYKEIEQFSYN